MKAKSMIMRFAITFILGLLIGCSNSEKDDLQKADRHLKSAIAYQKQGQYRAAMLEAKNSVLLNPTGVAAYEVLVSIYNKIGAYGLTQSVPIEIVKKSDQLILDVAEAQVASKKYRTAVETMSLVSGPGFNHGLQVAKIWSEIYLYTKDNDALEEHLRNIENSESAELAKTADYYRAVWLLSVGEVKNAEERLNNYIKVDPDNREALTMLGDIALHQNRLEDAEGYYSQALTKMPGADIMLVQRASILKRLINVLSQLGRTGEAFAYQKILSDANPESYVAQQKFEQAMKLYMEGDSEQAAGILAELHDQYPKDKQAGTLLGLVAQKQGNNKLASELFGQFVDEETAAPMVIQAATIAKLSADQPEDALTMLREACRLQPNSAEVWAIYGLTLLELGSDPKEASRALERSLALDPEKGRLRVALAGIYSKLGNEPQALAQLAKAYELNKTDFLVQQSYFGLLASKGGLKEVEVLLNDYLKAHPDTPQGFYLTGWLLGQKGQFRKAEAQFLKVLNQADGRLVFQAYVALSAVHDKLNEPDKAIADWEKAIVALPTSGLAYQQWLVSLYKHNLIDSAEQRLSALGLPEEYWQPDYALAKLAMQRKRLDKAMSYVDRVLKKNGELESGKELAAQIYQALAFEAYTKGDVGAAKSQLLAAAGMQPNNMSYVANLIKLELEANDIEAAQNLLERFNDGENDAAFKAYLQGKIFDHERRLPDALSAYRESWQIVPSDLAAQAIFDSLRRSDQNAKATLFLDEWQGALKQSPQPLVYKAMQAQVGKDNASAKGFYLKALELNSDQPVVLNNLAWIVQPTAPEEALSYARRAYEMAPDSPAIVDTLGWMLAESGKVKEGMNYLKQALALAPDNEEIKQHVEAVQARL